MRLQVAIDERLPEPVEVAAYYVVTESLANVAKHAHATSATRRGRADGDKLVVEVVDDGVGGADTERGSGLRGLADRVEALGGRLRIWTPAGRRHAGAGGDPVRVAIAEDSVLLREGLARLLGDAGFDVVGQCPTPTTCCSRCAASHRTSRSSTSACHRLHTDEGLRAALEIRAQHPGVGVLVLSQYVELGLAMKLLSDSAEGVGYLLKDRIRDVDDFVAAVRRVADGGSALDPIIVSTLLPASGPTIRWRG